MKTSQIVKEINENGGFLNLNNWNIKEIAEWVHMNYSCSRYVAMNVAFQLI
jgi:hypothetical protein